MNIRAFTLYLRLPAVEYTGHPPLQGIGMSVLMSACFLKHEVEWYRVRLYLPSLHPRDCKTGDFFVKKIGMEVNYEKF